MEADMGAGYRRRLGSALAWVGLAGLTLLIFFAIASSVRSAGLVLEPSREVELEEERRFYDVRLPANPLTEPAPLLLVLHGEVGSASRTEKVTRWTEVATAAGWVVVYPEGVDGCWNDGRKGTFNRAIRNNVDDVAFLSWVIDTLTKEYPIDPNRIYMTGVFSGGAMALRYACEEPDRVAAVAVVSGLLPVDLEGVCQNRRPIPALFINGMKDRLMPYEGGEIEFLGTHRGTVYGAEETARRWAEINGCAERALVAPLPESLDGDNPKVLREQYADCTDGAEVVRYALRDSGHQYPGGVALGPPWLVGEVNLDLQSTAEVMAFFQSHSKKDAAP
jgi:polyhydroxybutyrate depolymerase